MLETIFPSNLYFNNALREIREACRLHLTFQPFVSFLPFLRFHLIPTETTRDRLNRSCSLSQDIKV